MLPCQSIHSDIYECEKSPKSQVVWLIFFYISFFAKKNYEVKFHDPLFRALYKNFKRSHLKNEFGQKIVLFVVFESVSVL